MEQTGWYNDATCELLTGFRITAEDTVIDVGCGDGDATLFSARCGAEVIFADIDAAKVESVRAKLSPIATRGAFRGLVSDSNPLPVDDATATKVVCLEVLEHVDDPVQFLAELVRVGKPQAQYLISVPDPAGESIQRTIAAPAYWAKPNHVRIIERDEFDRLVRQSGLQIERRVHYSFFWAMWWILFWGANQELEDPEGPLLKYWTKTWHALITNPKAAHVKKALDEFMPKSQVLIARKAA